MLCRALVACGRKPVPVFDLTAKFDGLGNGRVLQKECTTAMLRAGSEHPGFQQQKPMRQSYHLYCCLKKRTGSPVGCLLRSGRGCRREGRNSAAALSLRHRGRSAAGPLAGNAARCAGQKPGRLDADRIAKLDKLGIEWKQRSELAWERAFAAAKKYRDDHGDLLVPVRYHDRSGFALGEWIVYNRQRYISGNLTRARIERLEAIGMVWNASTDLWEQSYAAAARYYLEHKDLEAPIKYVTPDGFALGVWLSSQRSSPTRPGDLTEEQIERLEAIRDQLGQPECPQMAGKFRGRQEITRRPMATWRSLPTMSRRTASCWANGSPASGTHGRTQSIPAPASRRSARRS